MWPWALLAQRGLLRWWPDPLVSGPGSKGPGYKSSCAVFFYSRNYRKLFNHVKFLEYSMFVRKMQMTYQTIQKNEIYILVSTSCMLKLL
jgi:hypothetical protein